MTLETCSYATDRLAVAEWHEQPTDLAAAVASMMTEPATRSLPPAWHGAFDAERATAWIATRDAEGPTLLIRNRATREPLGLVILYEEGTAEAVDVRLGYILAESAWGRGLASELVEGLVAWCRTQPAIASLTGGVDADNPASARVLEKNGFRAVAAPTETHHTEYRLALR